MQLLHRRLRSSALRATSWMTNGSPMIEPTVRRGFSDEYGSWKIICISRRSGRSSAARELRDVAAVEARSRRAVGSSRRSSRRAVVDLPQPDSPTRPSVSPGCDVEGDAVHRAHGAHLLWRTTPRSIGKRLTRSRISSSVDSSRRPPVGAVVAQADRAARLLRRRAAAQLAHRRAASAVEQAGGLVALVARDGREVGVDLAVARRA